MSCEKKEDKKHKTNITVLMIKKAFIVSESGDGDSRKKNWGAEVLSPEKL